MIVMSDNHVPLRSEELDEVWWQGRQWAVTRFGLECRDGTYTIAANRLYECYYSNGEISWSWPHQIAGKGWEDIHGFCTAYAVALALHPRPPKAKAFKRADVLKACTRAIRISERAAAAVERWQGETRQP
jgi:hypothetical protein